MKAPALCLFLALGAGIALVNLRALPVYIIACLALLLLAISAVLFAIRFDRCALAAAAAAWAALGSLALCVQRAAVPQNSISALAAAGAAELSVPLHWRGWLRSDPERLPYGWRFEIDLSSFQTIAGSIPCSGGMRATYYDATRSLPRPLRAGDEVELLAKASLPRNFGDPGAIDYRAQLAREGIDVTATLRSLALVTPTGTHRANLRASLAQLRGRLLSQIDDTFPGQPNDAALLRAMVLGDRAFVDSDIAADFQKTSSYHVLVVAGLHVAALVGFIFWFAQRIRLSRLTAASIALAVLVCYLGIVQDRPPILRAALMASIYLVAVPLYRGIDPLQSVAIAAVILLVARPAELFDPSFQLSFLAVGAIAAIGVPWLAQHVEPLLRALTHISDVTRDPRFAPKLVQLRLDLRSVAAKLNRSAGSAIAERTTRLIAFPIRAAITSFEILVVSSVIQFGLLPLSVSQFHRLSLLGPIANVGAVLLASAIVLIGFLTLTLGFATHYLTSLLQFSLHFLLGLLIRLIQFFSRQEWSNIRPPTAPLLVSVSFLISLAALGLALRTARTLPRRLALASALLLAGCFVLHPFAPDLRWGKLEATVLDVGQGDSIFLATPAGRTLLVDGGGIPGPFQSDSRRSRFDVGEEVVSRYLWSRGISSLDAVALTHAHEDHLQGLTAVLENFRVNELWAGHDVESTAYRSLLATAQKRGTKIVPLKMGDQFSFGGADIKVLWPESGARVRQAENDDSLVLRVGYGIDAVLLAGDIEHAVEARLTGETYPLDADFLKVPHHGSKTSSTEDFLARVRPSFAAISVGENNLFGHPSDQTLEHLRDAHAQILRTDRNGAITYLSNGRSAEVSVYLDAAVRNSENATDRLSRQNR